MAVKGAVAKTKGGSRTAAEKPLVGQTVLVTGASRGIGRAIASELAARGAAVALTYQNRRQDADAAIKDICADGGKAVAYCADVTDFKVVQQVIEQVQEQLGTLTGLVNNAGIVRDRALMMMAPEDWRAVIETNLTGTFHVCRAAIVSLMKQRYGRIINLTSVSGLRGMSGQANYAASKAGIIGFTRALAKEVAAYGITVNAIAPGYIAAGMAAALDQKHQEVALSQIPMKRFGTPEEVACAAAYLLSDAAAYITGQVFVIDGGLSL